jgi:hypothetical protein
VAGNRQAECMIGLRSHERRQSRVAAHPRPERRTQPSRQLGAKPVPAAMLALLIIQNSKYKMQQKSSSKEASLHLSCTSNLHPVSVCTLP